MYEKDAQKADADSQGITQETSTGRYAKLLEEAIRANLEERKDILALIDEAEAKGNEDELKKAQERLEGNTGAISD